MLGVGLSLPQAALRRRVPASPAAFTPADLFASGEAGAWYDPSDLSTLWQDTAGTTAVTADGQSVARIDDKSGNGNHATQATASKRPVYKTDGSLHRLLCDGIDDWLSAGIITITDGTGAHSSGVGARETSGVGVKLIVDADDNLNSRRISQLIRSDSGTLQSVSIDGSATDSGGTTTTTEDFVATQTTNADSVELFKNSVGNGPTAVTSALTLTSAIFTLGARDGGAANHLSGSIYAAVHVAREITAAERAGLESWLARKSGVTL